MEAMCVSKSKTTNIVKAILSHNNYYNAVSAVYYNRSSTAVLLYCCTAIAD
jgi:hypothetical protein